MSKPDLLLKRILLYLNLFIIALYVSVFILFARENFFIRADFTSFYTGWAVVRGGEGKNLYNTETQLEAQDKILGGRRFNHGLLPYINPPHLTLPFLPFTCFNRDTAFWLWTGMQLFLVMLFFTFASVFMKNAENQSRFLFLVSLLAYPPLFTTLKNGTFSLILLVCFSQFYFCLKRGKDFQAGLFLSLTTLKPQFAVFPLIFLLARRRFRAVLSFFIFISFFVLVSFFVVGFKGWANYFTLLRRMASFDPSLGTAPAHLMYNMKGTLALLADNHPPFLVNALSVLAFALAALFAFFLCRREDTHNRLDLKFSVVFLAGLLFSPHLYSHDALLYALPALVFYAHLLNNGNALSLERFTFCAALYPCVFLVTEHALEISFGVRMPVLVMTAFLVLMLSEFFSGENSKKFHNSIDIVQ